VQGRGGIGAAVAVAVCGAAFAAAVVVVVCGAEDVDVVGIVVVVVGDGIVVDYVDCGDCADCCCYDDADSDSADFDCVRVYDSEVN
jgi:hypothetical protein